MKQTHLKNPITLIKYDFEENHITEKVIWTFNDIQSVVEHFPILKLFSIGPKYKIQGKYSWGKLDYTYRYFSHTLRDSFGDYVDINNIKHQCPKSYHNIFSGRKRSSGHYYRRFRTLNERKQSEFWKGEEFTPKPRARRNFKNLPDSWDDCPISSWKDRNWKKFRKHQWKN